MIKFKETKARYEVYYYKTMFKALSATAIILLILITISTTFDMSYIWTYVVKLMIRMATVFGITGICALTYEFYKTIRDN